MNNGIFYYNGKSLDDLLSAKQTIFTSGVVSTNNKITVYEAEIKGGASELFLGNTTLLSLLNAKHPLLSTTSDLSIRTLTATNIIKNGVNLDTLTATKKNTLTAAEIITISNNVISANSQDTLTAGSNITISNNVISATQSITQADLDTKQNTLTSSTNILTSRIDVSDKIVITNLSPTLYLKDTDHRSGMIHMFSNRMYFLSGVANTKSLTQVNGKWPLVLYTDSNRAEFGGNLDAVGELKGSSLNITGSAAISSTLTAGGRITGKTLRVGPWIGYYLYWLMDNYNDENLGFYQERFSNGQTQIVLKGYIEDDGNGYSQMNFTGQHRCFIKKITIFKHKRI
jgi:hypothetical protein